MRLIIALLYLLLPFIALASGPKARFETLSLEQGLSQSSVNSILEDSKGFLWLATYDGLNRYDGYEFKVFRHDPQDPHSISNNTIRTIFEDSNGTLWIGTIDGLNKYDRQNQRFSRFIHDASDPNSLSNGIVWAITQNAEGKLWVGTDNGLNLFNPQTGDFSRFMHNATNPDSLSHHQIRSLYQDSKDTLWVGTNQGGLNRFNKTAQRFEHFKHNRSDPYSISHNSIYAINEDDKGAIWVGTYGGGLNKFNVQSKKFRHFTHSQSDPNSLSHNNVIAIYKDNKSTLWVGTEGGGLNQYDAAREHFVHFKHQSSDPHSLGINVVTSIHKDKNGTLWVGTYGAGVSKYNTQSRHFKHFSHHLSDPDSLSYRSARSFYQDNKGVLWVGTDSGLNRFEAKTQGFTQFKHLPENPNSLSNNGIRAIHQGKRGKFWIGTFGGGLNQYDPHSQKFTHFKHSQIESNSLSHNRIMSIHEGSKNNLWIGTLGGGLNRFDLQNQQFKHFRHQPDNPHSLSHDRVNTIYIDNEGILWVGTVDGLNRFNSQTEQFERFKHQTSHPNSLSNNFVMAIVQDSQGTLWVGTDGGLNKYDRQSGGFSHYRKKQGLANDVVYGIVEDNSGHLWLSTNQGLARFNPVTETFKHYNANNGLQSNEFNIGAYYKGIDGELFFGGINGFNRFFPKHIKDDTQPPAVVLTGFRLLNKPVPIQQTGIDNDKFFTLDKAIDELAQLTLSYRQNLISFEFSALHFANPMKNQYAYQLEGWDKDWIFTSAKNRRATYTNIPAGHYILRVKASNASGYWNEQGKSLNITILPPPWQTGWAYALYALLLLGLLRLLGSIRAQRTEQANQRRLNQQLKQAERTAELEQSNRQITTLIDISTEISSTLDTNKLLETAYTRIKEMMDVDSFLIGHYQPQEQCIVFNLAIKHNQHLPPFRLHMTEKNRPAVWCIDNKKEVIINDIDRDFPAIFGDLPRPAPLTGEEANSLMYWPLIVGDHIIGVLSVQSKQKNGYKQYQQDIIKTLASTMAIALDNAAAYAKVAEKHQEVEEKHREVVEAQQQLVQAEKMASLGTLTAGVAHEINNPTSFVHVSAQNLEVDLRHFQQFLVDLAGGADASEAILESFREQFEPLHSHLVTIQNGTERIKTIVQDLRVFTQLDAAAQKIVSVTELMQSTINLVQTQYLEVTKIVTEFNPIPDLLCYPAQLNQVFMNLIVNACDTIGEKQQQQNSKQQGQITIGCCLVDEHIEISIKDNGDGMTEETKNKLFEPFYTTKEVGKGTGLGLSISFGIVQKHQGELTVESELGVGTEFLVRLPVKQQRADDC